MKKTLHFCPFSHKSSIRHITFAFDLQKDCSNFATANRL